LKPEKRLTKEEIGGMGIYKTKCSRRKSGRNKNRQKMRGLVKRGKKGKTGWWGNFTRDGDF
jgi:hypothetical protein